MKKNKCSPNVYILFALAASALWGSLFSCIKLGYDAFGITSDNTFEILLFAGLRFFVCGIIILTIARVKKEKHKKEPKNDLLIIMSGFFTVILHYSCMYIGLSLTAGSKASVLGKFGGFIYVFIAFLFVKDEKFKWDRIVGAVLGIVGIILLEFKGGNLNLNLGDLLVMAASVCNVIGNLFTKKSLEKAPLFLTTGISQLFGGMVLVAVALIMGARLNFTLHSIPIFSYICIASTLAYCLWNFSVKYIELSRLQILQFTQSIFGCLFGWILIGENIFLWNYLIAFIIIILGTYIGNRQIKKTY